MARRLDKRWSLVAALALTCVACDSGTSGAPSAKAEASAAGSAKPATTTASTAGATASAKTTAAPTAAAEPAPGKDPLFTEPAAIVETHDGGSAAFLVQPDGATKVAVADAQGNPVTDRSGKLTFVSPDGAQKEVPLTADAATKTLTATGPKLTGDVTAVRYELTGGTGAWNGILHVPSGGTKALVDSAKTAAEGHAKPATGPHGGTIERVGDDDVEVLVDPDTGEARAWIIGPERKVVKPEGRTIKLLIDDKLVELKPADDDGLRASIQLRTARRVTLVHAGKSRTHVILIGFRPGVRMPAAAAPAKVVVASWEKNRPTGGDDEDKNKIDKNPDEPGQGHAKGKEKQKDGEIGPDRDKEKPASAQGDGKGKGKGDGKGQGHGDHGKGKDKH